MMFKGWPRRVAAAGVVLASVTISLGGVGAAGASGAGRPAPAAAANQPAAAPRVPEEFDALVFFSDVFAALEFDPSLVAKMRGSTVADSVAYDWLTYIMQYSQALGALAGYQQYSVTLAETQPATEVMVCAETGQSGTSVPPTTGAGTMPATCAVFADFVTAADGRLESFTINGTLLDGRLGTVDAPLTAASTVVGSAFRRISDQGLLVPLEITAGSDSLTFDWTTAAYLDPSGARIPLDFDGSLWSLEIAAGTTGYAVVLFPGATPGGVIEVAVGSPNTVATVLAEIPVVAV
jgi:hypothetical protein